MDADDNEGAQQISLTIDRELAKRLGIDMSEVMDVLNNSFSQRQISTIFNSLNQYRVVMEVNPQYAQYPDMLKDLQVITQDGKRVPLSAFTHYDYSLQQDRSSEVRQCSTRIRTYKAVITASARTFTRRAFIA